MQVTMKNAGELKPGSLVWLEGKLVRFVKEGSMPYQLIFEDVEMKENYGHIFIDLSLYEPFIITASEQA